MEKQQSAVFRRVLSLVCSDYMVRPNDLTRKRSKGEHLKLDEKTAKAAYISTCLKLGYNQRDAIRFINMQSDGNATNLRKWFEGNEQSDRYSSQIAEKINAKLVKLLKP